MRKLSEGELGELMAAVPVFEDYESWLKVIGGCLALVEGDEVLAERLLQNWQAEDRPGAYRAKLRSFRGGSRGAGWLVNLAKAGGWQWPKEEREAPKKPLTVSKPLKIRDGLPKFYSDGAFYEAENAKGFPVTIWVPAELVGGINAGDVVICHGRGTKRELKDRTVQWTFWAKKVEKEIKD